MTMITSTLSNDSLFDATSFSSRPFQSRPTGTKLYSPSDLTSSLTNFNHNIWHSKWSSLENSSDHVLKNDNSAVRSQESRLSSLAGSKRPQPPSLAMPNIQAGGTQVFGAFVDRRSPIGSERGTTRESEPHSARSRSQFESSSLTPTSFTNDSEISSQQNNTSLDQRRTKDPFAGRPSRELTNIWLNAPEFQPSLSTQQQDPSRIQPREPARNAAFGSRRTTASGAAERTQTNQWHYDDEVLLERNVFRPVQSAGMTSGRKEYQDFNFLSSDKGFRELNDSFVNLGIDREIRRPSFPRTDLQTSTNGGPRYISYSAQDHQQLPQYATDQWNDRSYAYNQNVRADSRFSQLATDFSRLNAVSGTEPLASQHNNLLRNSQSAYANNLLHSSNSRSTYEPNSFGPSSIQLHQSNAYGGAYYGTDLDFAGTMDHKDTSYNSDMNSTNAYSAYNSTVNVQPETAQVTRSALLEEFRVHGRTKKYELKDIFGHIVEFSGDQLGSRFIQHKLEVANSEEKDRVFNEIASDCKQLMTDLFGNYVIQKLFEHGNQAQKKLLAGHMKGHMMALSTQAYGCRVVQKALDHVLTDQQASLIRELDGFVLKVVDDQNGNHVIQKAIEVIPGEHIQFIVDAHRGHVHNLSKHAYGCRVIQRMLEHCKGRAKRNVLDELHKNIGDLVQDPFGNYVVQHVIVNGEPHDRRPVIETVQSKLLENAMHKFASNVVEKALDYAEDDQRYAMLQKLTGRDEFGHSQILKLLSHQFGNYVIQKTAAYLEGHELRTLLDEMEQYLAQLRRVSTGKQTSALESSIRDARMRLTAQRAMRGIEHAPTEPIRYNLMARRQAL